MDFYRCAVNDDGKYRHTDWTVWLRRGNVDGMDFYRCAVNEMENTGTRIEWFGCVAAIWIGWIFTAAR